MIQTDGAQGGLNLAGLGDSDSEDEEQDAKGDEVKVVEEVLPEERYKVLIRQAEIQINTHGAAAGCNAKPDDGNGKKKQ